jgi:hypothetical protein
VDDGLFSCGFFERFAMKNRTYRRFCDQVYRFIVKYRPAIGQCDSPARLRWHVAVRIAGFRPGSTGSSPAGVAPATRSRSIRGRIQHHRRLGRRASPWIIAHDRNARIHRASFTSRRSAKPACAERNIKVLGLYLHVLKRTRQPRCGSSRSLRKPNRWSAKNRRESASTLEFGAARRRCV